MINGVIISNLLYIKIIVKRIFSVVILVLFVNLIAGIHSPAFSQYLPKTKNLKLSDLNRSNSTIDSTFAYKPLKLQPVAFDDLLGEYAAGFFIGNAGAILVGLVGLSASGIGFDPGGGGGGSKTSPVVGLLFLSLMATAQIFGSSAGVFAAGTNKSVGADFGTTLLGSLCGLAFEIGGILLTISLLSNDQGKKSSGFGYVVGFTSISLPTVGAMIGMNSTRYPKRVYNNPKSAFSISKDKFSVSAPSILFETDKSPERDMITFAKIFSVNF